ncbi:MAG TPA: hypothetical protein VIF64_08850 [Pyrinomonadaceae bacterium]
MTGKLMSRAATIMNQSSSGSNELKTLGTGSVWLLVARVSDALRGYGFAATSGGKAVGQGFYSYLN